MSRKTWIIFSLVQIVGEACFWTGPHILSRPGPALWVAGIFLLFPGKIASTLIMEKLLWTSRVTLLQTAVLEVPLGIAINVVVWLSCAKLQASA